MPKQRACCNTRTSLISPGRKSPATPPVLSRPTVRLPVDAHPVNGTLAASTPLTYSCAVPVEALYTPARCVQVCAATAGPVALVTAAPVVSLLAKENAQSPLRTPR